MLAGKTQDGTAHPAIRIASLTPHPPHHLPAIASPDAGHHDPVILVAEGGYVPHAAQADDTSGKLGAALTTILFHVAIALLFWVIVISIPKPRPFDIIGQTVEDSKSTNPARRESSAISITRPPRHRISRWHSSSPTPRRTSTRRISSSPKPKTPLRLALLTALSPASDCRVQERPAHTGCPPL